MVRPRGNRGELLCVDLSKGPERYLDLGEVLLFDAAQQELGSFSVEEAWLHQDQLILKFAGIDSISDAERFRGGEVRIPFSQRAPLPPGEYYLSDLPGCAVVDDASGAPLGIVAAALEMPGSNLIELETGILIPLTRAICPVIDPANRLIRATLPDGLLELNRN
ncbi:MAG: 16S rRNA processing protein RimM [Acidobacteriaceae bacterium]|nr:16S rRNA processing protein RimM [Acidobacteriaceae bacterium]